MWGKKIDLSFIVLLILFLLCYFYYDHLAINLIIRIGVIGVFVTLCSYVLYGLKYNFWIKSVLLFFICLLAYKIPSYLKEEVNRLTLVDDRFYGTWITDTAGGFSVNLRIKGDSAYLSQSNLSMSKGYQISIGNDTVILNNKALDREYKWKYNFANGDSLLLLYSLKDSLVLKKVE